MSRAENPKQKSLFREYAEAIGIALLLALFIRTFIVQAFKIPSGSMIPTLLIGDHILVNKFIYGIKNPLTGKVLIPIKEPQPGDIVVFRYPLNPSQDYIKRVIGIEGDTIEVVDKTVFVNGKPFDDTYGVHLDDTILPRGLQPRDNFGPVTVPADSLFVMGDNRDNSADSRFWGFVPLKELRGKAFILYWSWDIGNSWYSPARFGSIRWGRIGDLVD